MDDVLDIAEVLPTLLGRGEDVSQHFLDGLDELARIDRRFAVARARLAS